MAELITCGVFAVFFTVMLFYGWMTTNVFLGDESVRVYPSVVLIVIILCLLFHCVGLIKKLPQRERKSILAVFGLGNRYSWRLIATIAVTIVYFSVLDMIGFVLTTPFICMYYMFVLGERKWFKLLPISLGIVLSVYAVFTYGLEVRLPRGVGVFRELSLFLEYLL